MKKNTALWIVVTASMLAACVGSGSQPKDLKQASTYNLQLGIDHFRQGNLVLAKEKIDRAIEQDPSNANAHMAAGLLYDRLGEDRKADSHFGRAVSLDGNNPEILNNYAVYLCRKGKAEKGEEFALKAATNPLYKTPEAAFLNAGFCASSAGNFAQAEAHFRRALAIRPNFPEALIRMADLEFRSGNYLPARAFLERYMQAVPANATALWLGVRIEQGLGNRAGAGDYARRLKNEFPTAGETKELLESERQAG